MIRSRGMRYQGTPLVSQKRFRLLKLLFLVYSLGWVALLIYVNTASWVTTPGRVGMTLLLVFVSPTIQDLIERYQTYEAQWQADNRSGPTESNRQIK